MTFGRRLIALIKNVTRLIAELVAWALALTLGFVGLVMAVSAIMKPINPGNIGLFTQAGGGRVVAFTLATHSDHVTPGKDVFGMGWIPLALVIAVMTWATAYILIRNYGWGLRVRVRELAHLLGGRG